MSTGTDSTMATAKSAQALVPNLGGSTFQILISKALAENC
jgi:hypothetical protein